MFKFIKRWNERCRRKTILKDIKAAKAIYLSGSVIYMCQCFYYVDVHRYHNYENIRKRIPEFKPSTFNVDPNDIKGAWWSAGNRKSRIEAFDKLIEIYSR